MSELRCCGCGTSYALGEGMGTITRCKACPETAPMHMVLDNGGAPSVAPQRLVDGLAHSVTKYRLAIEMASSALALGRVEDAQDALLAVVNEVRAPSP